jgi:HEPN domain-containing protein
MDLDKHVDYWRSGACEDWSVGVKLAGDGKTRHGLFFVHLALEKALKAVVCRRSGAVPPRTHNLVRLAELAGLQPSPEQLDVLAEMNARQLEGRYPDLSNRSPSQQEAGEVLRRAEGVYAWLTTL